MTRIAVTGASGFVGRHAVAHMRACGYDVRPIVRRPSAHVDGAVVVDFGSLDSVGAALRGASAVVHLAGLAHVSAGSDMDAAFMRVNCDHALLVGRAAARAGVRMVFVSSAGVLGDRSPPDGLTDSSPLNPYDPYTRSKAAAETTLRTFADESGAELVVVRPPVVIGPDAPGNFGRLLRQAGRWPLPIAALKAPRSFIGARNLAAALVLACVDPRACRLTFAIAEPEALSVAELARCVAHARGRPARLVAVPPPLLRFALGAMGRSSDVTRLFEPFVLRGEVASVQLGWRPPYDTDTEVHWAVAGA